jgi:LysR family transcriptional activator of dmlA
MNITRTPLPLNEDLRVFLVVVRKHSFAKAAIELGVSPAYVSKRINILESMLNAKLFHRSTRNIALTEDGEKTYLWANRILGDLDDFISDVSSTRREPQGKLRIVCSFGFGRNYVAPALSLLARQFPKLDIQLITSDKVVDLVAEGFDLEISVGNDLPNQHIAKKLLANRRILCASPNYLNRKGVPVTLDDLVLHDCLVIKEKDVPFGSWQLNPEGKDIAVRIDGRLSSNSGSIVLQWGLDGHGIFLRSLWDVKPYLDSGQLIQVLPDYYQQADIWAVYPTRLSNSAKLKVCVEGLERYFNDLGRQD